MRVRLACWRAWLLLGALGGAGAWSVAEAANAGAGFDVEGLGIAALAGAMASGQVSAAGLVRAYQARIAALDRAGPTLHAVIALNPDAIAEAEASDRHRAGGGATRALEGIPILIKDNIEVAGPMPTTAGSLALAGNVTGRDAPLVARLRAAGAVILGKTNLSEWANFRGSNSISGWSGVGGLTRNPYALDRSACGSSSGSGAAVAASLAAAAIGTETDGSITCPAGMTGLVGFKPTVGLVSRTHVVPISATQDTAGPMTRDVADAALVLSVIAGSDPADPATMEADRHLPVAPAALAAGALRGRRIGVARFLAGKDRSTDAVFAQALDRLRAAGAVLVDIEDGPDMDAIGAAEMKAMLCEFKSGLDTYLSAAAPEVTTRSLAAVIAFNKAHAARELGLFGQELMEQAEATGGTGDPGYREAVGRMRRLAGAEGLDRMFAGDRLDALVAPTGGPAWLIDVVTGDHDSGSASTLPAVAGLPHLTVPMGMVDGLPVGLSLIGPAWSEARLLDFGSAFEALSGARPAPGYLPSIARAEAARALLLPTQ